MEVEKIRAEGVFRDKNEGFVYGLQEISDFPAYIEWFKTEKERDKTIKKYKMKCLN